MKEAFLRLLFPERCAYCATEYGDDGAESLCTSCRSELSLFSGSLCERCGRPDRSARSGGATCRICRRFPPAYDSLITLGWYRGPLESVIKAAKFADDRVSMPFFTREIMARIDRETDAIVILPSDHALNGELARSLSKKLGVPIKRPILRSRMAKRQVGLSGKARRLNARNVLRRRDEPVPERILLLDDIVTTGASIDAAAELLRDAGARWIQAAALARAPKYARRGSSSVTR